MKKRSSRKNRCNENPPWWCWL